jgi:rfaE bifunctional protein kinase chain/domain/rfaE bifunctional protein nucleotidyltransferase chain/domain
VHGLCIYQKKNIPLNMKTERKTYQKIKNFEKLVEIAHSLRAKEKRIVLCHGVFDLLHPGHIRHLESAKQQADILIVTLTKDRMVKKGPGRPVFNQQLRAESLAALSCVDYVAINEWPTAVEAIKKIKPHLYAKGAEYSKREDDLTGKIYDEENAVRSIGGDIYFTNDITFSSTSILNTHFNIFPNEAGQFLRKFKKKYCCEDIITKLKSLKDMKVLVIGDTIIDSYCYCTGMGKPSKDNIIAAKYLYEEEFAGGTLAVANHVAGFCDHVSLVSLIGSENGHSDFIKSRLKKNIKRRFFINKNINTIVKKRFLDPSFLSKMFELCYLDYFILGKDLEQDILAYLDSVIKRYDLVIVSDFGHGFISPKIVKLVSAKAKFLAVNTQLNSANAGFNLITKYPRADYICIDEPEIRMAMQDRFSNLRRIILALDKKINSKLIAVTKGHEGAVFYEKRKSFVSVPVFSKKIVDRTGAGDACLSVTALAAASGMPIEQIGFICNAVGALAVLIVGNKDPVEPIALYKFIVTLLQ